ncbi:MAG: isomerase [Frankiales bacterium]|nr:isomerase [Frankiales bacterium]
MTFFLHPQGLCESTEVGEGTRIWAFAHVLEGAVVGADCNVCDGVFIEGGAWVGDRVTLKCGVQLWDGVTLGDDVFIGPNVTFTNDPFPRSKQYPQEYLRTRVDQGASVGANATLLPGIRIGRQAMIGAGSVVTKDVPPNAIVVGNPARIVGYTENPVESAALTPRAVTDAAIGSKVPGVRLIELALATDMRGSLVATELETDLPFVPRRTFVVFDVPSKDVRGEHAHRVCEQVLVCVRGSVVALVDDGRVRQQFTLDSPRLALYIPPMIWGTQYHYSADAVLLVYASHPYDKDDYIRDYDDFMLLSKASPLDA